MGATLEEEWAETDRQIAEKEQAIKEKQQAEASRWQGEIDVLSGRASHPERDVEHVDLDTGKVVTGPTDNAIAMPLYFSQSDQDEIGTLLQRRNRIVADITDLIETPAENPDQTSYASQKADELKAELGAVARRLYVLLTANPLITEDWLAENPTSWRPRDLGVLIARFEERNAEVVERIRRFRSQRDRRRMGRVPEVGR
jgi:hypothetical protein